MYPKVAYMQGLPPWRHTACSNRLSFRQMYFQRKPGKEKGIGDARTVLKKLRARASRAAQGLNRSVQPQTEEGKAMASGLSISSTRCSLMWDFTSKASFSRTRPLLWINSLAGRDGALSALRRYLAAHLLATCSKAPAVLLLLWRAIKGDGSISSHGELLCVLVRIKPAFRNATDRPRRAIGTC